jgi:drug/metabolite transporter (DMT)-like permease
MGSGNKLVYGAAILYALIIGLSFLFVKVALPYANPFDLLAYRFSAALIAILIFILLSKTKINYSFSKLKRILPLTLFNPLMFFAFQTFGLEYASSSEAGILSAAIPIFTLILATIFLKEHTTGLQKISVLASVLGVIYITLMKGMAFEGSIIGIALLLISMLSFSGYSVLARKMTKDFTSLELSFTMILVSCISFTTLAFFNHLQVGTLGALFSPLINPQFILSILYLGVLSTFITFLLSNYILSKLEASKMSVFINLSTVVSIIAGMVILNEAVYYYHIIGSILIVGGVLGTNFLGQKQELHSEAQNKVQNNVQKRSTQ